MSLPAGSNSNRMRFWRRWALVEWERYVPIYFAT